MANSVSRPVQPLEPFDRTPYIFKKVRLDDMGNEIEETFYSAAGRKEEFRYLYPDGYYITELIEKTPNFAMFRCSVYLNKDDAKPYRIAHATRELDTTTEIGRRYVECAETAAIGRALANAGIGADALLDELDGEEQKATGGTPVTKKPAEKPEKPAPAGKKKSEKNDAPKEAPGPMTDEEALGVVITTTSSKSLKGKTFGESMTMVRDPEKFKNFLAGIIEKGKPQEQEAAKIILAKFSGDPKKAA